MTTPIGRGFLFVNKIESEYNEHIELSINIKDSLEERSRLWVTKHRIGRI